MKAPKYTRSVCVGGLGLLAAASLIAAALPVSAQIVNFSTEAEHAAEVVKSSSPDVALQRSED